LVGFDAKKTDLLSLLYCRILGEKNQVIILDINTSETL